MGIRRVTSSTPCLISLMRTERSVLKSASSANKAWPRSFLKGKLGGVIERIAFKADRLGYPKVLARKDEKSYKGRGSSSYTN
eukprot:1143029-Pelagomonas_calceolata.AAC.4